MQVEAPGGWPRPHPPAEADAHAWSEYFDALYRAAGDDSTRVPWARGHPSAALVAWLNSEAPAVVRPGASVCVSGCGLGEDVRELADRGYDVTGLDLSPCAVSWARRLHPDLGARFTVADLFDLPSSMKRRADLVVEVNTIQSVHPGLRERVVAGIAALARPRGVVLAVCRGCDPGGPREGPPYALTCDELTGLFEMAGFAPIRGLDDFEDDETPPTRRLRGAFRRA